MNRSGKTPHVYRYPQTFRFSLEHAVTEQHIPSGAPRQTVFEHSDGHVALYVDGGLAFIGVEAADIFRQALTIAGVDVVESDDFLRGVPDDVTPETLFAYALPTLAEIDDLNATRLRVEELRKQAEELAAEADALERALRGEDKIGAALVTVDTTVDNPFTVDSIIAPPVEDVFVGNEPSGEVAEEDSAIDYVADDKHDGALDVVAPVTAPTAEEAEAAVIDPFVLDAAVPVVEPIIAPDVFVAPSVTNEGDDLDWENTASVAFPDVNKT
jgi:hypothetical protein